jgi:hypothetical protein
MSYGKVVVAILARSERAGRAVASVSPSSATSRDGWAYWLDRDGQSVTRLGKHLRERCRRRFLDAFEESRRAQQTPLTPVRTDAII